VLNANDTIWPTLSFPNKETISTISGGTKRCDSVLNGLLYLQNFAANNDWILVHDAVRPCLQHQDIDKLISQLNSHPVGGLLGVPVKDTLKRIGKTSRVLKTVERKNVWHALTPQMFRYGKLITALQKAIQQNIEITDEAQAVELSGEKPVVVEGRSDNIKITYPQDFALAEKILNTRSD
jgi:2-C-methyl-D-erythritol 4-phosphate cytidylyltransferase